MAVAYNAGQLTTLYMFFNSAFLQFSLYFLNRKKYKSIKHSIYQIKKKKK